MMIGIANARLLGSRASRQGSFAARLSDRWQCLALAEDGGFPGGIAGNDWRRCAGDKTMIAGHVDLDGGTVIGDVAGFPIAEVGGNHPIEVRIFAANESEAQAISFDAENLNGE